MKMQGSFEACEVQRFVMAPLIDRTIPKERKTNAACFLVPGGERCTDAQRNMATYDPVAAKVAYLGLKVVHRAAFALGGAGGPAEKLGHRGLGVHAKCQRMSMVAIAVDQLIFALLKNGGDANSHGFLPAIQVTESPDALPRLGVFLVCAFFEAADEHHHPQAFALGLAANRWRNLRGRSFFHFIHNSHFTAPKRVAAGRAAVKSICGGPNLKVYSNPHRLQWESICPFSDGRFAMQRVIICL